MYAVLLFCYYSTDVWEMQGSGIGDMGSLIGRRTPDTV